jgi:hypothetical protein
MILAADRQKAFEEDLEALLEKHGAEMEITNDGSRYMTDYKIEITMMGAYNSATMDKEYCEFFIK